MQFIVYTRRGDSHGATIAGLIRALLSSRMVAGHVQLIDDPDLLRMNYISNVPTVMLDGSYISSGYVPTRSELETAIDRRQQALALSRSVFENTGDSRRWRR
ncbi:hypothetical protein KDL29_07465 [bacterium]|nr:hypothetical protein [bacterium]MCB1221826.1 hypothetical protein [bacterium]UNM06910.1 MAG: hypothetical protein H7A35_08430 [Planctomycetales bacterium]